MDGVDAKILHYVLQAPSVRQQIQSSATGTGRAMKNITQPSIMELNVMYPPTAIAAERLGLLVKIMTAGIEAIKTRKRAAIDRRRRLLCETL